VAAVAIYLQLVPQPQFDVGTCEGTQVYLTGTVDRVEYRNGKKQLYLKHVVCDSSHSELVSEFCKFNEIACICYLTEGEQISADNKAADASMVSDEKRTVDDNVLVGSRVTVSGKLCMFDRANNPGEFDTRSYYAVQKIYFSLQKAWICGVKSDCDRLANALYRIRRAGCSIFDRYLSGADAGILRAMLLGDRTALEKSDKSLFTKSGISHVLAISGVKTLKLDIPLVPETRINWAFVPLHIAIIYILKLCLDEEIIPRCRFPCSRGYFTKCIN